MILKIIFAFLIYAALIYFILVRSRSFTYRHRLLKIILIAGNCILLCFISGLLLFGGKPHLNFKMFALYFQVNFVFLLLFFSIILLFIFYFFGDAIVILFLRKARQGTKIAFRNLFHKIAVSLTGIVWFGLFYGYFIGVSNFRVKEYELHFARLPENFSGVKVLHFSDTHLGSFLNKNKVKKGIQLINKQNADLILFTGDLVNISAEEAYPYIDFFASVEAKFGKYAVLGNHDMSDYMKMDINRDSLNVNTEKVVEALRKMGFIVLRDTVVNIISKGDTIQLAGMDNCGNPPFKCHGNPEKVFSLLDPEQFTILLSHDPSFWNKFKDEFKNVGIDLTLSGHTHGMQTGIRTKNFQWSPALIKYSNWCGLYYMDNKVLHVNPGFGFIGLPVRIGIYPEITVINLNN